MDWSQPVSQFDDELKLDLTMSSSSEENDSDKENDDLKLTVNSKVDNSNSTQTLVGSTKPRNSSLVQGKFY